MRDCSASGLEAACSRLAETPASGTGITLHGVSSSAIADLDPEQACRGISAEMIAGVSQRLTGRLSGTLLFAVDPGDALLWLQREGACDDPLAHFVEWGGAILSGVAGRLASAWQADLSPGAPMLVESPFMAALLSTHAPSDTVVVSLQGDLSFDVAGVGEMAAPFNIQVLLEPKVLDGILSGLSQDSEDHAR